MPNHYVRGCDRHVTYARANLVNVTRERLAAAMGIPIIHMRQNSASFVRTINEPRSEAVANLLGLSLADCRTEAGMQQEP